GGIAYAAAALILYAFASPTPAYVRLFLPGAILNGLAIGFVLPSLSAVAAHGLPPDQFALGVAVNQAVRQVGSVLGVAFVIASLTRAGVHALAPFHAIWILLIIAGLATALFGAGVATAPGDETALAPGQKRPAQRGRQLVLPVIAAAALVFSI